MIKKLVHFFYIVIVLCVLVQCNGNNKQPLLKIDAARRAAIIKDAPVLSPQESLDAMAVEEGFEVKLVASEPLISTPVALNFDAKGRIWALEMQGYMPDSLGNGENMPDGKIVILEDENGDGVMDERKLFMDSLVLPRAICLIENGILVAEPPRLWYVEIKDDKPVKKTLIDTAYTSGGNVEHQPNGLFRGLDNWIYSANSTKRYRKKGAHWLIEPTHDRGQWGLSQDDYGRLYYNNNSQNLIGDYFMPGLGAGNLNQQNVSGYDIDIVENNRVYPARPTPGVNRGYMDKILDDSLRLVNFTAACGPVIYRSGLFAKEYYNNAFVAEPSANLIKRNILTENGYSTKGEQAYNNHEFLTSIDERFRPVSLYDGPDGALYVVDMYRGIIQHKTYLTDYLKGEIKKRKLTNPLTCGRIYKIVPKGKSPKPVVMPQDTKQLVALLQSPEGWVRDKAQQMLVDEKDTVALPLLKQNLRSDNPLAVISALWTMEGLGTLQAEDVLALLQHPDWKIRAQALTALSSVVSKDHYQTFVPVLLQMIAAGDSLVAPYIAFQVNTIQAHDAAAGENLLLEIVKRFPNNVFVADAVISNLEKREAVFFKKMQVINADSNLVINKRLTKTIADIKKNERNKNTNLLKKIFPAGVQLFQSVCKTCHGEDGNGMASLAPPLNLSSWVVGSKDRLIAIVLQGLTGPIKVNNKVYKAPEISGEMPGLAGNKEVSDDDIAQVLSFIRKNWGNRASLVTPEEVTKIRKKLSGRQAAFTADELNDW